MTAAISVEATRRTKVGEDFEYVYMCNNLHLPPLPLPI